MRIIKLLLLIVVISINSCVSFAQTKEIDSLNQKLLLEKNDLNKIKILLKLCELCEIKDNLIYANQTLSLINKLNNKTSDSVKLINLLNYEADAYTYIGYYYINRNFYNQNSNYDPNKAILYFNKSKNIYKNIKKWDKIKVVYENIENIYLKEGNLYLLFKTYKEAIEFGNTSENMLFAARYVYLTASLYAQIRDSINAIKYAEIGIAIEKKINDPIRLSRGYELGADLFYKLKKYQKAIQFYKSSLNLYKLNNDSSQAPFIYLGLGKTYIALNDYKNACSNLKKALSYTDSLSKNNVLYTEIMIEYGKMEYHFNNYNLALIYLKLSLMQSEKIGFPGGIAVSCYEIAKNQFKLNQMSEAKIFAEKSLSIIKKISSLEHISKSELLCFRVDSALGNYKNSLKHYIAYNQLKNKIDIEGVRNSTMKEELQNKFKQDNENQNRIQKQKDIETTIEINKQRSLRNSFIIGFILLSLFSIYILKNYIEKKKYSNEIIHQKRLIEEKHKEITDSINYAERIQRSFLATKEILDNNLGEYFVFFKPKDVVSGDFYWATSIVSSSEVENNSSSSVVENHLSVSTPLDVTPPSVSSNATTKPVSSSKVENNVCSSAVENNVSSSAVENFILATADSTGHGVPGAIMSILNIACLNEAVKEGYTLPNEILNRTRKEVINVLKRAGSVSSPKIRTIC